MTTFIFQLICVYLFVIGILFITLEFRTQFARSFLYAGITILLAGLFCSIDIWFLPHTVSPASILYWIRMQHIIAMAVVPVLILHITSLGPKPPQNMRLIVFLVVLFSILLLTPLFIRLDHGEVGTSLAYVLLFVPFALACMIYLFKLGIDGIRARENPEKSVSRAHLMGLILLVCCAGFDLLTFTFEKIDSSPYRSATILGVLGFGIMQSILFSERFLVIMNDRKEAYTKLRTAFKDLEEVNSLKKLGEASAMINHEIGNYLCVISGQAQLLKEFQPLSDKGRSYVDNILSVVARLHHFSQDILDLSKSQIIKDKKPLHVSEIVKSCIQTHFSRMAGAFDLDFPANEPLIYGDWGKLDQVFRNIFKNSLDAASSEELRVSVRILTHDGIMLILVEDNGVGCTKEQMGKIFKAFFTTKQGEKGTGLGMSITRTILQAHGGSISAYSKNLEKERGHGLKLQMVIPIYDSPDKVRNGEKSSLVLIKDGIRDFNKILQLFQNVNINPWIAQSVAEADPNQIKSDRFKVMLHVDALAAKAPRNMDARLWYFLSELDGIFYIFNSSQDTTPEVFSEEYIIRHLT